MTAPVDPVAVTDHGDHLVVIDRAMEPLYRECYEALGWEFLSATLNPADPSSVLCAFRRDDAGRHRHELDALQRDCDRALTTIARLQRRQAAGPLGAGVELPAGMAGVAFLVGAVAFAAVGWFETSMWAPLAVAGALACTVAGVSAARRAQTSERLAVQRELLRAAATEAARLRS